MAKDRGAPYRPGKRAGMVKVKRVRTIDAVVAGYRPGKEPGTVGSLILGLYDPRGQAARRRPFLGSAAAEKRALVERARALRDRQARPRRSEPLEDREGPRVDRAAPRAGGRGHLRPRQRTAASATARRSSAGARTSRRASARSSRCSPEPRRVSRRRAACARRLGATRVGSPACFLKCGGHGASGKPGVLVAPGPARAARPASRRRHRSPPSDPRARPTARARCRSAASRARRRAPRPRPAAWRRAHRRGPHAVGRGDGAVARVLVVVDEDAVALLLPPLARGDLRARGARPRGPAPRAARRTSSKSCSGSMRTLTWMPREPLVLGKPVRPWSRSTSPATSATWRTSSQLASGVGSRSTRSSSGWSRSGSRTGHGFQSITPRLTPQTRCAASLGSSSRAVRPLGKLHLGVCSQSGAVSGIRF